MLYEALLPGYLRGSAGLGTLSIPAVEGVPQVLL